MAIFFVECVLLDRILSVVLCCGCENNRKSSVHVRRLHVYRISLGEVGELWGVCSHRGGFKSRRFSVVMSSVLTVERLEIEMKPSSMSMLN